MGLVSMGLVRDVSVSGAPGAAIVNVELGITEPGCMMQGIFSATAEREIRVLPGVADVAVRIDHGYVWDPDDMAAEYRARLSMVRAERRLRAEQRLLRRRSRAALPDAHDGHRAHSPLKPVAPPAGSQAAWLRHAITAAVDVAAAVRAPPVRARRALDGARSSADGPAMPNQCPHGCDRGR